MKCNSVVSKEILAKLYTAKFGGLDGGYRRVKDAEVRALAIGHAKPKKNRRPCRSCHTGTAVSRGRSSVDLGADRHDSPTYHPSTIYVEIDVSSLPLIDAERYFNAMRAGFPMPCGCSARGRMDLDEVEA